MGLIRDRRHRASTANGNGMLGTAVKIGCAAALCGLAAGVWPANVSSRLGLIAPAYADDTAGPTVSLDIEDADIHQVAHMLSQQTGVSIDIQDGKEGDPPYGKVNITLNHIPLEIALKHIALSANAVVTKDPDGIYVIEPNLGQSSDMTDPQSQAATPQSTDEDADYHWQKLNLIHAVPYDVLFIMHWDQDYRALPTLQPLSYPSTGPQTTENSNEVTTNQLGPSVPVGNGQTGQPGVNYAATNGNSPNQAAQFPGGVYTTTPTFPNQFPGQQQGPTNGAPGGPTAAAGGLPQGVRKIYALQSDNSLLVLATPDGFQRIKEIVKNLDIAPKQVQIKVEFVTASVSDIDEESMNFNLLPFPGASIQSGLSSPTASTISLQYAAGTAAVTLLADLERDHSKVVQSPLITTTNNVQASVSVTTQVPYTTNSVIVPSNGGNTVTSTTEQFENFTTGLTVQPRINSDDTVTLQLAPMVTTPGQLPASGPPPSQTEQVNTLRTVKSGETMVIGGLISKTDLRAQSRIPILADLPIIGNLFRNRNVQLTDQELLIFVTPTIIGDENGSSVSEAGAEDSGGDISVTP